MVAAVLLLVAAVAPVVFFLMSFGDRAERLGYPTSAAYLAGAPRTDAEKRDAVDLALKGLVLCILGLFIAPVMLGGLVGLFYGGRKLIYASMGLGLVDDGERPGP